MKIIGHEHEMDSPCSARIAAGTNSILISSPFANETVTITGDLHVNGKFYLNGVAVSLPKAEEP